MKRILTLMSAALLCSSLSFGQDTLAHADISVHLTKPSVDTTIAHGDSLWVSFNYTNYGPDMLPAGDTLFFDISGLLIYSVILQPMLPGNTFIYNDVAYFYNPTDSALSADLCIAIVPQSSIQYTNGGIATTTYIDDDSTNDVECHQVILEGPDSSNTAIRNMALSGVNSLEIYPNPVTDKLRFDLPVQNQTATLNVIVSDVTGRTAMEQKTTATNGQFSVNVSDLPSGVYILKTKVGAEFWRAKFVKK